MNPLSESLIRKRVEPYWKSGAEPAILSGLGSKEFHTIKLTVPK